MLFKFIPREEKFFDLFEQAASKIAEGARLLKEMIEFYENPSAKASKIKEVEHELDIITHTTIERLNKTFVTPLDREDIHSLISHMDDVLDSIEAVARRLVLYKVEKTTPELLAMVKTLIKAIEVMSKAIIGLRDMKHPQIILNYCIELNSLENEGDDLYRIALAHLFDHEKDPIELIKWKEIYEIMEASVDCCEDVANVIEGVVVKHA